MQKTSGKLYLIISIAIFLLILGVLLGRYLNKNVEETVVEKAKSVSLLDLAELKNNSISIKLNGVVESAQQIELKAQLSAELQKLNVALGDYVVMGQVLANFKSDEVSAAIKAAEADLRTAEQAQISFNQTDNNQVITAKTSLYNTLLGAYTSADDIVKSKLDTFFDNPDSYQPTLKFFPTGYEASTLRSEIEKLRKQIQVDLENWQKLNKSLTAENVSIENAKTVYDYLLAIKTLSDKVAEALNKTTTDDDLSATVLSQYQTLVSGIRSGLTTLLQGLTTAQDQVRSVLDSKILVEASVEKAQAQLLVAQANNDRTKIIAPFSGQVAAISFKQGEFVPAAYPVIVLNNATALQVKFYLSVQDLAKIKIGQKVTVDGRVAGVVSNVANMVDANLKKVEAKITLIENSNLLVGQNVSIDLGLEQGESAYLLPIQAVKVAGDKNSVLTVENGKIVEEEVEVGEIYGDLVEIKKITANKIISPVYDLEIGQDVTIAE